MATYTEHYNLIKPALNDKVNINNLNDNADIIDTVLNNKVDTDETRNITTSAVNCMMSDGTTSVEDALDDVANGLITPNGTYSLLGYDTISGSDPVSVSLGNNNISDYDFLLVGTSYYNQGVATYGCTLIPVLCMQRLFSVDAGVCFMSRDYSTNKGATPVNVIYNSTTNSIEFRPSGIPNGIYYYVNGVKIRTAN